MILALRIVERQRLAKEYREIFCVSSCGASMDDAPIHVVPYDDLGIR